MNRLAVVSGGTRGIGRGIVSRLAQAGYRVVFTFSQSAELAKSLEQDIRGRGYEAFGYQCDATSTEDVQKLLEETKRQHGQPHALINNVGITRDSLLISMKSKDWADVISTNMESAFNMTKAFLPGMFEAGEGSVIQMSSVSGLRGNRGQANYASTKAGLIGFSKALAMEAARFNVRVNAVAPGFIETEMIDELPPQRRAALEKMIPLRRLGSVDEVAALVEFLLSKDATYITGQTFVVDGGIST